MTDITEIADEALELEYSQDEFYEDLHHLVQPVVGRLRWHISDDDAPELPMKYMEERLFLTLALSDLALGKGQTTRTIDLDRIRDLRADHGCGFFRNEDDKTKAAIQERFASRRSVGGGDGR